MADCAFCGSHADRDHHLTGRGADHDQLDPSLVVPLCHCDHELIHDDLRQEGVHFPLSADSVPERVERQLRRLGLFLSRLCEATGIAWWCLIAGTFTRSANLLRDWVGRLDAWNPRWRTV